MAATVIEQNDSVVLWYHPDTKIVHHECKKFVYGDTFKSFLTKGTETMKKNGAKKWLSDDRKNPVLRSEDLEWGVGNWFPATVKAGWKYWAIVQPEGAMAKHKMEELASSYAQAGINAKFFSNPEDAMKWLVAQP